MERLKNFAYKLLRSSESFFKTDMIYLAKGGFWLSLNQGSSMVAGFLLSITFANLFPQESYGTYKFILSVTALLGVFSLTGISTAITQAVATGVRGMLAQGFRLNLKWCLLMLVSGLALGLYYFLSGNMVLAFSFCLAAVTLPLTLSANLYDAFLLGKKDFRRSSLYGVVSSIASAVTMIVTLLMTKSLYAIMAVYFIVGVIVPLLLYKRTRTLYPESPETTTEFLSYGAHLSAMDLIGRSARYLDKILIFHYLGAAPLAVYAFAIAPIEQLQGGKKIIATLIMPKASGRSYEELQKSAPRKTLILTVYALSLSGLYIFLAPYLYSLVYPQYLASVKYSQVYSLTLLAIAGTIFNETLVAHKKKKELYLHRTVSPILQIILFFTLLPSYGLMGLVVTHVFIRIFNSLFGYYLVMRSLKTADSS